MVPEQSKPANDEGGSSKTVIQQVLESFYEALAQKPEYKDIADRFRAENGRTEEAIRKVLFGGEV